MQADSESQSQTTEQALSITARWLAMFEDRHGAGAYDRLRGLLDRPCVSYAEIAQQFRVSRECVRQWHKLIMPEAPRGHARQRLCAQLRQRKQLLSHRLFRSFFTHVRRYGREHRLELVRSNTGYRTQMARLDGRLIALRDARAQATASSPSRRVFTVPAYHGPAEFLYVRLGDDDYLFVPAALLTSRLLLAIDSDEGPGGMRLRNSFAALWNKPAAVDIAAAKAGAPLP